ncbi:brp/Blh family beta-carotene 15,15'-monooxygenase [Capnocytophaga sp. oral taxon 338 str. F0234]|nr:brp/Blh family beta-carotene 15,15'-monooxygenase [Capnocytophaga sp. oral taxon 338 str. F0234]
MKNMNANIIAQGILKAVGMIVGVFLLCLGIYKLQNVIIYVILASVLALIGRPIIQFLKKKLKFKNTWATITSIGLIMCFFIGLMSLFIPMLITQGKNLASIDFQALNDNILLFLDNILLSLGFTKLESNITNIPELLNMQDVSSVVNGFIEIISNLGMGLFSVFFIAFFFMKDGTAISNSFLSLADPKRLPKIKKTLEEIKNLLSRYFVGLFLQLTVIFVLLTIVLLIFGVGDAVIIAFLCALLNLIPYLGPIIGAVVISVLTISNFMDADVQSVILPKTIYVLIGFLITQLIDNVFSQPIIFSNSVKSNPLEIFLITLISGTLFGIVGMVVAIPAYTVLKVILKAVFPNNKFVQMLTSKI